MEDQILFKNPQADDLPYPHWGTIRWNAAFEAAHFITQRELGRT